MGEQSARFSAEGFIGRTTWALALALVALVTAAVVAVSPAYADSLSTGKAASNANTTSTPTVPVYRLYNIKSGEHLYTTDANERNVLSTRYVAWTYEGIAFSTPKTSSTKVHRLYNRRSGEHLYTTDNNEVSVLTKRYGWTYEGTAWYTDDVKRIPVYRLYNPKITYGHHYTADANEKNVLTSRYGWRYEGISWYSATGNSLDTASAYSYMKWNQLLNSCLNTKTTTVKNGSITNAQRDTLNRLGSKTETGFIALNVKTGKMVSRNPDQVFYSASTMKAINVGSMCKRNAPGIGAWGSRMYYILTYSNNDLYNQICNTYGRSYLERIAADVGVTLKGGLTGGYAFVTPRDLAKMWTVITQYIRSNETNAAMYRSAFGKGYYKEGWMYNGMLGGQLYNIVGVDGDVIYAVMSRYIYQSPDLWSLRNTLIAATR